MMLEIKAEHLQVIKQEAIKFYPHECCGLLVGTKQNDRTSIIEVIPTLNDWENQKQIFSQFDNYDDRQCRDTFSIDPLTMLQVQKQAREKKLAIVGIYHSHPDHPAIPSEFDRKFAWQEYSYIIVTVAKKSVTDLRSWILNSDHVFQEESITS